MPGSDSLLNTVDVAALLSVHPKHVYRLLRRGLPGHRMGGEWRFSSEEVLRWVESGGMKPRAVAAEPVAVGEPGLVAANGDVAVECLLARVNTLAPPLLGFVQADRDTAMALLRAGRVLAAGCHAKGPPSHLDGARLARIHLVQRAVGLVVRSGAAVPALADLPRLRVASRPATAGIRAHLDDALARDGVVPAPSTVYNSHRDAVLAVVRGEADVALTTQAWAWRFGLPFGLLATEAYGLVVCAVDLGDPRVIRICEVAQSPRYRDELAAIPGYDARGAGDIRYDS